MLNSVISSTVTVRRKPTKMVTGAKNIRQHTVEFILSYIKSSEFACDTGIITAVDAYHDWVHGEDFLPDCKPLRHLKEDSKVEYEHLKQYHPYIIFGGVVKDRKDQKNLMTAREYSGYMIVDLDAKEQTGVDLHNIDIHSEYRQKLFNLPFVQAVFKSVSGYGLKLMVSLDLQIKPDWSDQEAFDYVRSYYEQAGSEIIAMLTDKYGLVVDENATKDVLARTYIAYDAKLLMKTDEEVVPYHLDNVVITKKIIEIEKGQSEGYDKLHTEKIILDRIVEGCERSQISITDNYHDWFRVGMAIKRQFGDEGFSHFDRLSQMDGSYDPEAVKKKWVEDMDVDASHSSYATIHTVLRLCKEKGVEVDYRISPAYRFKYWFLEGYQVVRSECDGMEYYLDREKGVWSMFPWDDLPAFIAYARDAGIEGVGTGEVTQIVRQQAMENTIHPLRDYMNGLKWDGVDRFDALFDCIEVDNPELFRTYFMRWFVNLVATAYGREPNEMVLVLQGEQGNGKSYFFLHLLPSPKLLGLWMVDTLDRYDSGNKDHVHKLISTVLVVFDEMAVFNKTDIQNLKSLITQKDVKYRTQHARVHHMYPKITSFCGTTNADEFLRDDTGDRRYLVFKYIDRDHVKFDAIDKEQLFAQAIHLFKEGFDYKFSRDDYRDIMRRNVEEHTMVSNDELMVRAHLVPASSVEDVMTYVEIIERFRYNKRYEFKSSPTAIGSYLKKAGIEKRQKRYQGKSQKVYLCKWIDEGENQLAALHQAVGELF